MADDKPAAAQAEEPELPSTQAVGEDPILYCPVCSKRLNPRMCKLVCDRCGYYMSCEDYY